MKDFYVYLPSNTPFLSDNKASKYVTKLAKELNLGSRWECCLKEIHYPRSWNTLTGDEGNFYVHRLSVNVWEMKSIPTGYYSDGQQIVNALNHSLKSIKASVQLLEHSGIVKLLIPADLELVFAEPLSSLLGMPHSNQYCRKRSTEPTPSTRPAGSMLSTFILTSYKQNWWAMPAYRC